MLAGNPGQPAHFGRQPAFRRNERARNRPCRRTSRSRARILATGGAREIRLGAGSAGIPCRILPPVPGGKDTLSGAWPQLGRPGRAREMQRRQARMSQRFWLALSPAVTLSGVLTPALWCIRGKAVLGLRQVAMLETLDSTLWCFYTGEASTFVSVERSLEPIARRARKAKNALNKPAEACIFGIAPGVACRDLSGQGPSFGLASLPGI